MRRRTGAALPAALGGWCGDLVCHLVIDAQDVLVTPATPDRGAATVDAHEG